MKSFAAVLCVAVLLVVGVSRFSPARAEADESQVLSTQLSSDVGYLADDLLEGREAGARGYDLAALYVAQRMKAMGLEPAGGNGSYFQKVSMRQYALTPNGTHALSFSGALVDLELAPGRDYYITSSPMNTEADFEANAVFVGYGFVSRTHKRDDFAGVDVKGKIAVILSGVPKFLNSEESAHFNGQAAIEASKRGAIGTIFLSNSANPSRFSFDRIARFVMSGRGRTTWVQDSGQAFSRAQNIQASAGMSADAAAKMFARLDRSWADTMAAAGSPAGKVEAFDMGVKARIKAQSQHRGFSSNNVLGVIQGIDRKLRDEYVVVTAHLDHVGIRHTDAPGDDEIFNGAMDNASGVAAILEAARLIAQDPPKRSVIFIALTAEEKGLIGADVFAHYPTVPKEQLVAAINIDMPVATYDFQDVIAFGAERSTLFTEVRRAASNANVALSPDPMPEQGIFTRSDHYRFVQQGIPSAYLMPGFANGGAEAWQEFLQFHYHRQSDEIGLVNFDYLARFASLKHEIIRNVANMKERPKWHAGDFFGVTFNGPMAEPDRVSMLQVKYETGTKAKAGDAPQVTWPRHGADCGEWMYPCME